LLPQLRLLIRAAGVGGCVPLGRALFLGIFRVLRRNAYHALV
jgi:hypothetical protein